MKELSSLPLRILQLTTAALAVAWMYASYKNNWYNLGGGYEAEGSASVTRWLRVGEVAAYSYLASWASLIILTLIHTWRPIGLNRRLIAWGIATLVPLALLFASHWWFHRGFPPSPV